jgi:hypothetical protein
MTFYRVKTFEHFISIDPPDGGTDSVVYAVVSGEESEAIPQNKDYTLKDGTYRITETWFDNYENAKALADRLEPCHPHDLRRTA